MPMFVHIETTLDLPSFLGEVPVKRVTHVVEKAVALRETAEMGLRGFEEGWVRCRWQAEKLCPSQSFDALDPISSMKPDVESLLLLGKAEKKMGAMWHAALNGTN